MKRQDHEPTRRAALTFGAGLAGVAAMAGSVEVTRAEQTAAPARDVDVVVVGAVFSGLTAGRHLRAAGHSVVVLEADDRVGGRTKAGTIAGEVVDLGGQWVGPSQTHLLALAREFGVATYQQYANGKNIADFGGYRAEYEGETPALEPAAMEEFLALVGTIEAMAAKVPVPHPWDAPDAAAHDSVTFETWLVANAKTPAVRSGMRVIVRALLSAEPTQVSLLC